MAGWIRETENKDGIMLSLREVQEEDLSVLSRTLNEILNAKNIVFLPAGHPII